MFKITSIYNLLQQNILIGTKLYVGFVVLFFILNACKTIQYQNVCVAGLNARQERSMPAFDKISIQANFDVELIHSDKEMVAVFCDSALQHTVLSSVQNQLLTIKTAAGYNYPVKAEFIVKVYYKNINSLASKGFEQVFCNDTIHASSFCLDLSSMGKVNLQLVADTVWVRKNNMGYLDLRGACAYLNIENAGMGGVYLKHFKANMVSINNSAMGDIVLFANTEYNINNLGSAHFTLLGDGLVNELNWQGTGTIKRIKTNSNEK